MYSYENRVTFSQIDENGRMKLHDIVNVLQDCSCAQSDNLGRGRDYIVSRRRAWLLNSWQILIDRNPVEGENYTVETRAWKFERFYGQRNFAMIDTNGQYMVRANSVWFYVDTDRLRPIRPDAEDIEPYGLDEPLDMEYASKRKMSIPEELQEQESFVVRRVHLDTNHHVNNAQYVRMAEEYFPADREIAEIRVEYRTAAKYTDRIVPRTGVDEEGWITVVLGDEKGEIYAVVKGRLR